MRPELSLTYGLAETVAVAAYGDDDGEGDPFSLAYGAAWGLAA